MAMSSTSAAGNGLENQCWKDSWDSILFADGTLATLPRATCEIQGYAYDAKYALRRLAREVWGDPALAERAGARGGGAQAALQPDFWLAGPRASSRWPGRRKRRSTADSNIGHLLWSGIVDDGQGGGGGRST